MNKIISYIVIVVLSIAGFSAFAKEVTSEPQKTLSKVEAKAAELAAGVEKVQKQLSELDAQKNERMKVEIERDRKGIEFWFAALAILTAIGALFPFLLGRKEKELLKLELAGVKNDRTEIQLMKDAVEKDKVALKVELQNAKDMVASISHQHSSAEKSAVSMSKLLTEYTSNKKSSEAERLEVAKEVNSTVNDPNTSEVDKLRAHAVEASQFESPTLEQAQLAFSLWNALSVIKPKSANAFGNAGYWATEVAVILGSPSNIYWLQQSRKFYAKALKVKPQMHEAAYNFAISLMLEANELANIDPQAAQTLWQLAGEKYKLALDIKPNSYKAANNWGVALGKMAAKISQTDLGLAHELWEQAEEKYTLALEINPDSLEVVFNLACLFSLKGALENSIKQLEIARKNKHFKIELLNDNDLDNVRKAEVFQVWKNKHFSDEKL